MAEKKITVSKELSDYIIPLNGEEFKQLEQNIIAHGCRDPLTVWRKNRSQSILIDGHNRFRICNKHKIPFEVKYIDFDNIDEVKVWMVENQIGRRNLTPDQLSYYRGLKYLSLKRDKGGYSNVKAKGQRGTTTSGFISDRHNVSESTVKRDAKFAEGLNIIGERNLDLKMRILSGDAKVKKSDVQTLSNAKNKDKLIIKNEADLHNKAKLINEEILNEIEARVEKREQDRIKKAQESMDEIEPMFLDYEARLRKIKGRIISAINRAIREKDTAAINELRSLVDALVNELN